MRTIRGLVLAALLVTACGQKGVGQEPAGSAPSAATSSSAPAVAWGERGDPAASLALGRRTEELADALAECKAAGPPPDAPGVLLVWVDHDVTDAELEDLRQAILAPGAAKELSYEGRDETDAAVREFYADRPEVLKMAPPDVFPTRFIVSYTTVAAASEASAELALLPQVDRLDVTTPGFCQAETTELSQWCREHGLPDQLMVWLHPGVSDEDRARVADLLSAEPDVLGFVFWDSDASLAEFEQLSEMGGSAPATLESGGLPTSFRVDLEADLRSDLGRLAMLRGSLSSLPGVSSTDIANREFGDHCL